MPLNSLVRQISVAAFMLALTMLSSATVSATTVIRLPFDKLVLSADMIVRGECTEKTTQWVNGHIETTYKLKVDDVLKGSHNEEMLEITMLGGRVDSPVKMAQYIPQMPTMYKGEKAVLFLSTKRVKMPPDPTGKVEKSGTRLLSSPRVLGLWQGKFTIITDEANNRELVTRHTVENLGFVPTDETSERFNLALRGEISRKKNPPTEADLANKDWEKSLSGGKAGGNADKAKRIDSMMDNHAHGPRTLGKIESEKDVPFMMPYADLKAKISGVIKKAEMEAERERARKAEFERLNSDIQIKNLSPNR